MSFCPAVEQHVSRCSVHRKHDADWRSWGDGGFFIQTSRHSANTAMTRSQQKRIQLLLCYAVLVTPRVTPCWKDMFNNFKRYRPFFFFLTCKVSVWSWSPCSLVLILSCSGLLQPWLQHYELITRPRNSVSYGYISRYHRRKNAEPQPFYVCAWA